MVLFYYNTLFNLFIISLGLCGVSTIRVPVNEPLLQKQKRIRRIWVIASASVIKVGECNIWIFELYYIILKEFFVFCLRVHDRDDSLLLTSGAMRRLYTFDDENERVQYTQMLAWKKALQYRLSEIHHRENVPVLLHSSDCNANCRRNKAILQEIKNNRKGFYIWVLTFMSYKILDNTLAFAVGHKRIWTTE